MLKPVGSKLKLQASHLCTNMLMVWCGVGSPAENCTPLPGVVLAQTPLAKAKSQIKVWSQFLYNPDTDHLW